MILIFLIYLFELEIYCQDKFQKPIEFFDNLVICFRKKIY